MAESGGEWRRVAESGGEWRRVVESGGEVAGLVAADADVELLDVDLLVVDEAGAPGELTLPPPFSDVADTPGWAHWAAYSSRRSTCSRVRLYRGGEVAGLVAADADVELVDVEVGVGTLDVLEVVLDEAVVGLVAVSGGDVAAGRLANGTPPYSVDG